VSCSRSAGRGKKALAARARQVAELAHRLRLRLGAVETCLEQLGNTALQVEVQLAVHLALQRVAGA
jgi:hypothetical protein